MKFIIDAQLPPSWVEILNANGHEAIHTSRLQEGNLTPDQAIIKIADREERTVMSKDSDFYYSFVTTGQPKKLVFVKLGNMRIQEIDNYLKTNMKLLIEALNKGSLVELWPESIKVIY